MTSISVRRPKAPIRAVIDLPRSKSISNRALICAALAGDLTCVKDLSHADDTRILHDLLTERPRVMHCGLGGTTFRFLLAWAAVQEEEEHVITGEARLLERPHDDLLRALRSLGGGIERTIEGYRVRGRKSEGGEVVLDSPISSQFISALMMIAPMMREGLRIAWKGRRLSEPYVHMTAKVMAHFGAQVDERVDRIVIAPGSYRANALTVPPDWSAAAFWYEIAMLSPGAVIELKGLGRDGLQADARIHEFTEEWVRTEMDQEGTRVTGIERKRRDEDAVHGSSMDVKGTPDLFQPLAFGLSGLGIRCGFKGLDTLAHKESDRLNDTIAALKRMRVTSERLGEWIRFTGKPEIPEAPFDPRGDHRMAMALAPLALVCDAITILDPDVVSKSYPKYWEDLDRAGFRIGRS